MAAKSSSPASAFTKVLRSFETGGLTYRDVVIEMQRLLKAGASPGEMSEILRRREFIEPLPVDARKEVLGLLDAAMERTAATAGDRQAESAGGGSIPTPSMPIPESKLITIPVQMRGPPDEDRGNVIVRAISLARASALPARASAMPDSVRRKTGRMAPAAKSASSRRQAPPLIPTPADTSVTDGIPAPADAHGDGSDFGFVPQDPAPAPGTESNAPKIQGVAPRSSLARVIGWGAVVLALAAAAWLYTHHALLPKPAVPAADAPVAGTPIEGTPSAGTLIHSCTSCGNRLVRDIRP